MGICRQSFYNTFVSKHVLYLEALQRYNRDQATQTAEDLNGGATPIEGLTSVLSSFVDRCEEGVEPACLGTNAICKFGQRAAHFLLTTLGGLKISARAGMPIDQLRQVALLALQALR